MREGTVSGARWPVVSGALLAGMSVGLSAYAAHGVAGVAQQQLATAAAFAFGHGVALVALAGRTRGRLAVLASCLLLLGTLLFAGALAGKALFGAPSAAAPFGGSAVMLGWLLHALAALRR